jgi:hypothetical protein
MAAKKKLSAEDLNNQKIVNLGVGTANTTDAASTADVRTARDYAASLANATGTMLHTFISDFDTAVRASRLDQMTAPTGSVAMGSQRITGLADPSSAQDAATQAYVLAQISALSSGLVFKGAARVATSTNITIATPGATIDGVAPTSGDVVLLMGQTTGSQNGPWVWTGSAAALTRPTNWDTTAEAAPGSMWVVQQGTFDNQLAIMSNDSFTLNTTTATFVFLNPASAADNDSSYTETSPAVSAGAAWAVNHNLGHKNVHVTIYRTASPFDEVDAQVTHDTTNQVNVRPDIALSLGEYTVYVSRIV